MGWVQHGNIVIPTIGKLQHEQTTPFNEYRQLYIAQLFCWPLTPPMINQGPTVAGYNNMPKKLWLLSNGPTTSNKGLYTMLLGFARKVNSIVTNCGYHTTCLHVIHTCVSWHHIQLQLSVTLLVTMVSEWIVITATAPPVSKVLHAPKKVAIYNWTINFMLY